MCGWIKTEARHFEINPTEVSFIMTVIQSLYGHTSEDTAYLVEDYPYGRKLRCQIRYWIEKTSKGFRFCAQTKNPKNGVWNNPKKSTYVRFAACMFLDEQRHVDWNGIHEYSSANDALLFMQLHPQTDTSDLLVWARMKAVYNKLYAQGTVYFEVNGKRCEESPETLEKHFAESEVWREVIKLIKAGQS